MCADPAAHDLLPPTPSPSQVVGPPDQQLHKPVGPSAKLSASGRRVDANRRHWYSVLIFIAQQTEKCQQEFGILVLRYPKPLETKFVR